MAISHINELSFCIPDNVAFEKRQQKDPLQRLKGLVSLAKVSARPPFVWLMYYVATLAVLYAVHTNIHLGAEEFWNSIPS